MTSDAQNINDRRRTNSRFGSYVGRRRAKLLFFVVLALSAAAYSPTPSPAYSVTRYGGFLADASSREMFVAQEDMNAGAPAMQISGFETPGYRVSEGTQGSFTLQAPPTTKVTSFKMDLACNSTDGWQSGLYYRMGSGEFDGLVPVLAFGTPTTACASGTAGSGSLTNTTTFPTQNVTGLRLLSRCAEPGGCTAESAPGTPGYLHASGVQVTLEDPVGPTISLKNPGLLTGGLQSGTVLTTPHVADDGSGVAAIEVRLDGKVIRSNTMPCHDMAPRPCDWTFDYPFSVDTSTFAPGDHTVSLKARDYEGNIEVRSQAFTTAAPPPPARAEQGAEQGAGDLTVEAHFARSAAAAAPTPANAVGSSGDDSQTVAYGRAPTVVARVLDAGKPAAAVPLAAVIDGESGNESVVNLGRTAADGRLVTRKLVGRGNAGITILTDDSRRARSNLLTLKTRARIGLHLSPRRIAGGQVVRLGGRVSLPPGSRAPRGLVTEIWVVSTSTHQPLKKVAVAPVSRSGRFSWSDRFEKLMQPAWIAGYVLSFEARLARQKAFPFEPGRSRLKHLTVIPRRLR